MPDEETRAPDLASCDRYIKEGRERVRRQIALVRELDKDGHDTTVARQLLATLRETVTAQRRHRELIAELDGRLARVKIAGIPLEVRGRAGEP